MHKKFFLIASYLLVVLPLCSMEPDQKQPVSLYKYFKLDESLEHAPRDVQNIVIEKVVGRGGWWYRIATLRDDSSALKQITFRPPQGNMVATVNYDHGQQPFL